LHAPDGFSGFDRSRMIMASLNDSRGRRKSVGMTRELFVWRNLSRNASGPDTLGTKVLKTLLQTFWLLELLTRWWVFSLQR